MKKISLIKNTAIVAAFCSFFAFSWSSCGDTPNQNSREDTPITGTIAVGSDETLQPITDALATVFMSTYPRAKLNVQYKNESATLDALANDSIELAIVGRRLNEEELKYFNKIKIIPTHNRIGADAIALVVHPKNTKTELTYAQTLSILRGDVTNWSQVGGANMPIKIVFDQPNSGTVSFVLHQIGKTKLPVNAFALKTNLEAVDFVSKNESAIGIIGWSWISDIDDKITTESMQKISLVGIAPHDTVIAQNALAAKEFFKPYNVNLIQGRYPFMRDIYAIVRERRMGLAAGFSNFIFNDIGQRILMKAGLNPAQEPERMIQINNQNIKLEK
jgi:phosphate transport system substrate-binding protein